MNADFDKVLSEQHYCQFGIIAQCFAGYEITMQQVMANLCKAKPAEIATLTAELDFSGKRRALLDLLRQHEIPLNQFDQVFACLRIPHTYTPLLNAIAHCAWKNAGTDDSSIQPDWLFASRRCVEPACAHVDEPGGRFTTLSDENLQYTLEELRAVAQELSENHRFFIATLEAIDLLQPLS